MRRIQVVFFAAFCFTVLVNVMHAFTAAEPAEILWTSGYPTGSTEQIDGNGTYSLSIGWSLDALTMEAYAVDGGIGYSGSGTVGCNKWDIKLTDVSAGCYYCFGKLEVTQEVNKGTIRVTESTSSATLTIAGGTKTPKGEVLWDTGYPKVNDSKIYGAGTVKIDKDYQILSGVNVLVFPKGGGRTPGFSSPVKDGKWAEKSTPDALPKGTYVVVASMILQDIATGKILQAVNSKVVELTVP